MRGSKVAGTSLCYVDSQHTDFDNVDVHGTMMGKAVVFEGDYGVRSAFFNLQKEQIISHHTHTKWVQVMVISGCMKVEQEGVDEILARAGSVYFVYPHYPHTETALEETLVLVTQGEDRPGWQ